MKTLFSIILIVQFSFGFSQTILSGRIKPSEKFDSKFYILKFNQIDPSTPSIYDSVIINSNGEFSYKFDNKNPQDLLYKIFLPLRKGNRFHTYDNVEKNYILITTEGGEKINLSANADSLYYSAKIDLPGINKSLLAYRDVRTPVFNLERVYSDSIKLYPDKEVEYKRKVMPTWMSHIDNARKFYATTLDTTQNTSMILVGIFNLFETNFGKLDSAATVKNLVRVKNQDLLIVRNIKLLASKKKTSRIGLVLPNVTLEHKDGTSKQLHSIKSDFIIIDFWASWCSPCRYSNKNELPAIFSKYQTKVKLIGLTIDEDQGKWKKAVEKDNTTWDQYIDSQYILRNLLDAHGVPVYVVIDKNYKVIYETMSAYQLELYLDKLLK